MINEIIVIGQNDYKNIFLDIAEKLFTRELINNDEKVKLLNIINNDETFCKIS